MLRLFRVEIFWLNVTQSINATGPYMLRNYLVKKCKPISLPLQLILRKIIKPLVIPCVQCFHFTLIPLNVYPSDSIKNRKRFHYHTYCDQTSTNYSTNAMIFQL